MGGFEKLYHQHMGAVFRFSLRCVGRREIAEEITSEVFLALHRNFESIDKSQLPAWLFTVAKNRAVDYWRHCEREQRYAAAAADPVVLPEPSREYGLFESKVLKPIHRLCLILRYVHGMHRAEIAQRTGLSDNQIKSSLQYSRQLLRRQLLGDAR